MGKSMIRAGIAKDASARAELEQMLPDWRKVADQKRLGYENSDQSDSGVSDIQKNYKTERQRRSGGVPKVKEQRSVSHGS